MFTELTLMMKNESELYSTIKNHLRDGFSANEIYNRLENELGLEEEIEEKEWIEIELNGALFGVDIVKFYFNILEVREYGELATIVIEFDFLEMI